MSKYDVMDEVARYAPTRASVGGEWSRAQSMAVFDTIVQEPGAATDVISLQFVRVDARPRRSRWGRLLPLAASAAVLAVAAGVLVAVLPADGPGDAPGGLTRGPAFDPPA